MISGCIFVLNSLLPNEYEVLELNWNIKIPKADEVTDLLTTEVNFHGDGEWLTLYQYSKPIDFNKAELMKLTASDVAAANEKIVQFIQKTLQIHSQAPEIATVFQQHKTYAQAGDYYGYLEENNGYDCIILLYKTDAQQLYIYEWHQ